MLHLSTYMILNYTISCIVFGDLFSVKYGTRTFQSFLNCSNYYTGKKISRHGWEDFESIIVVKMQLQPHPVGHTDLSANQAIMWF